MKVIWEAADIIAGRRIGKAGRTEQWLIGYDPRAPGLTKWALISAEDGMLSCTGNTRDGLAIHINNSGDYPAELFPMMKRAAEDGRLMPADHNLRPVSAAAARRPLTEDQEIMLVAVLQEMVYETTHLSRPEDDGSHRRKISRAALEQARAALDAVGGRHPIKELRGAKPLVLYFENDADRDEFVAAIQDAKPGMRTVKLP